MRSVGNRRARPRAVVRVSPTLGLSRPDSPGRRGTTARAEHADLADEVERVLVGRDVVDGRWTFQIVEAYNSQYWQAFRDTEQWVRDRAGGAEPHLFEAELKQREQDGELRTRLRDGGLDAGGRPRAPSPIQTFGSTDERVIRLIMEPDVRCSQHAGSDLDVWCQLFAGTNTSTPRCDRARCPAPMFHGAPRAAQFERSSEIRGRAAVDARLSGR